MVATAVDQANLDAPASALVAGYLEELTALMRAALAHAGNQGRLRRRWMWRRVPISRRVTYWA